MEYMNSLNVGESSLRYAAYTGKLDVHHFLFIHHACGLEKKNTGKKQKTHIFLKANAERDLKKTDRKSVV